MTPFEIVTSVFAFWGAFLSSILGIREITKDRRRIKIEWNFAITTDQLDNPTTLIFVKAVNVGHRPVTLDSGGLLANDGQTLFQVVSMAGPNKLPIRLEDSGSVTLRFDLDKVKEAAQQLAAHGVRFEKVYFKDSEGKQYSKSFAPQNILN